MQDIGICITAVISFVSLFISFANYWRSKPKLEIRISNKDWDCFFGKVMLLENSKYISHIAGAKINIVNNSPVAITISDVYMLVNGERLRVINKDNPAWNEVVFVFEVEGEKELVNDGSSILYKENGLELPFKLQAYDTITVYALFHSFPASITGKSKAKIVLDTAIGNVVKRVNLVEYDVNYIEEGYRDYLQYERSIEVKRQ